MYPVKINKEIGIKVDKLSFTVSYTVFNIPEYLEKAV